MVSGTTIKPIAANPAHSAHRMWVALVERRAIIGAFFMCVLGPVVLPMLQVGQPRVAVIIAAGFAVSALVTLWGHESAPALDRAYAGEVSSLSEPEFDLLEDFVEREATSIGRERMAREEPGESHVPDAFETLVAEALDDLPEFMQCILADNVAVLVGDDGREHAAYGLYVGTTYAYGGYYGHRIHIYRDTLMRDFGHDLDALRREVTITVRHELAHHLGANERHVAALGL
jgi:predicted Zn-dependent protease with MMP-like domain